jgi:hypothetical protein
MNNVHLSHRYFFEAITQKKLNEFLKRADASTCVLQTHINERILPLTCKVQVKSIYNTNNIQSRDSRSIQITNPIQYCDVYIKYFDLNKEIGHLTIHLKKDNKYLPEKIRKNGRIHYKNMRNSCHTFKCTKRKIQGRNNSISFDYIKDTIFNNRSKSAVNTTVDILNEYLDFNSPLSLEIPMTNYKTEIHECIAPIIKDFGNSAKTKIRHTIKKRR